MRRATLFVLASAFLWGTSFPTIRVGLERGEAGAFTFLLFRFVVATLVLAVLALRTRHFRFDVSWRIAPRRSSRAGTSRADDQSSRLATSMIVSPVRRALEGNSQPPRSGRRIHTVRSP